MLKDLRSNWALGYLACPYSHDHPEVREERFKAITKAAAFLFQNDIHVFSPISATHEIDKEIHRQGRMFPQIPFWMQFDKKIMRFCAYLLILQYPGWRESAGVAFEVEYFHKERRPIFLMNANNYLKIKKAEPEDVRSLLP